MFSVCLCARFQANPKEPQLTTIKRIFRYLYETKDFGLWYPNCGMFALIGFSNADYPEYEGDKKNTSGSC